MLEIKLKRKKTMTESDDRLWLFEMSITAALNGTNKRLSSMLGLKDIGLKEKHDSTVFLYQEDIRALKEIAAELEEQLQEVEREYRTHFPPIPKW